jgi:hypothetical protein
MDDPKGILVVDQGPTQAVARVGILATLLPPAPEDSEVGGWAFEIELLPKERVEVLAIARARAIRRALRAPESIAPDSASRRSLGALNLSLSGRGPS